MEPQKPKSNKKGCCVIALVILILLVVIGFPKKFNVSERKCTGLYFYMTKSSDPKGINNGLCFGVLNNK